MKRIILLSASLFYYAAISAQPHTWLLYGTAGLSQNSNTDQYPQGTNTSWSVAPGIGYQFDKHITAGVQVSYSHIEDATGGYVLLARGAAVPEYAYASGNSIMINWSAGGFLRYTQELGQIFFLYGQANMSYLSSELYDQPQYFYPLFSNYMPVYGYYYGSPPTSTSSFQLQIFPAVGAKIYKGLALNFSFGGVDYITTHSKSDYAAPQNPKSVQITFGQQVNIGISDNFSFHAKHRRRHAKEETVPGSEYRHVDKDTGEDEGEKQ